MFNTFNTMFWLALSLAVSSALVDNETFGFIMFGIAIVCAYIAKQIQENDNV